MRAAVRLERIAGGGHSAVFMRAPFLAALRTHVRPLALNPAP